MKWIPLLEKTSHRLNRQLGPVAPVALQQFRIAPMARSSFVFAPGSKLCLFIVFPTNTLSSFKSCKIAPYMKKCRPRLKNHSPTRATQGEPTFSTFPYRNLAFDFTRNKQWARIDPFFDSKVTFLAKPTFLQVNTWLSQPRHY